MPTVLQVILSLGAADLAKHGAVLTDLASVETLGSTSAINSDKTGTLTMNQMTAIEVVDPTDRYTISGSGYELQGGIHHAAGSSDTIDGAILPYVVASDAALVDGKVVGDPTEGALLVLAHKAGLDIDTTRDRFPRLATLPFDPTYKLMAAFTKASDASGREVVRCFVKGAAPAVMSHAASALAARRSIPWDADLRARAEANVTRMEGQGLRVMAGRVDHDRRRQARRARRPLYGDLPRCADPPRQVPLRKHRDRVVDRADRVRADARRRGVRESQHPELDADERYLRQLPHELDRARGDRARGAGHAAGRFQQAARHETLTAGQFGLALAAAVLLLGLWELGKLIARRQASGSPQTIQRAVA